MSGFAIIGAAGYIAPRHFKAITDTDNRIVAACDPSDSVGILDGYGYDIEYFRKIEDLVTWLRDKPGIVQYMTVCSPNHLHTQHIMIGLLAGLDIVCEKPLVLDVYDIDILRKTEDNTDKKINVVLQLRLHPAIKALKRRMNDGKMHDVTLQYVTPRGKWYHESWKGDCNKSGGLAANIGIHFFDMLIWIFGNVESWNVKDGDSNRLIGTLELERANVEWSLSLDTKDLPEGIDTPQRSLMIDGNRMDFSAGFADLHTKVYEEILAGRGFTVTDIEPSLKLVSEIKA